MSVYNFLISKNNIARDSDDNITYDDPNGGEDIDVTLTVNGTEIHAATLVDAGCTLQYTGTLAEGYHTVKIQPEAGKPTDIRIDRVLIDDHTMVGSQYLLDSRIFGKSVDYLQYRCCEPFKASKNNDYVWWGEVYNADFTVVSNTVMYRPHVITDKGEWWEWSFSVTSNGHIHWTLDDSDSILYDSTENHVYYAAKSLLYTDSTTYPSPNYNDDFMQSDSSGGPQWAGPGIYDQNFQWIGSDLDLIDHNHADFQTEVEYKNAYWYNTYYTYSNVDPIIIT